MYFIGLDLCKKTISYCVKDAAGCVYQEGKIGSTRWELDEWIRTMPQPRNKGVGLPRIGKSAGSGSKSENPKTNRPLLQYVIIPFITSTGPARSHAFT